MDEMTKTEARPAGTSATEVPAQVVRTAAATALMEKLAQKHGALMFHQSGGCCDGSAPMCFQVGEFKLGGVDEKVGEIAGCEFWMDREQFKLWAHTRWTVDVVPGRGSGFSVEAPEGVRFLIRSRVFEDAEYRTLQEAGPPPRGPQH